MIGVYIYNCCTTEAKKEKGLAIFDWASTRSNQEHFKLKDEFFQPIKTNIRGFKRN